MVSQFTTIIIPFLSQTISAREDINNEGNGDLASGDALMHDMVSISMCVCVCVYVCVHRLKLKAKLEWKQENGKSKEDIGKEEREMSDKFVPQKVMALEASLADANEVSSTVSPLLSDKTKKIQWKYFLSSLWDRKSMHWKWHLRIPRW